MKRLVVLGAGTAGTMVVNKLDRVLPKSEWEIVVVEPSLVHLYQPGLLFLPFGRYESADLVKPNQPLLPAGVSLIRAVVERIDTAAGQVLLAGHDPIGYDQLVIATGTTPRPDMTPGLDGPQMGKTVHEFYTLEGAVALRRALSQWEGGRLVVHIVELPIKCPVAPLEFAFLADDHFRQRGMRDRVEITYVTPLSGAFTKPIASHRLGDLLERRGIDLEPDFYVERVDEGALVSFDERTVPFDLLVTVPLNMGADFVARSNLGDELNHVKVDPGTFLANGLLNVFAIGDAAALPTSKAGSVAHFAVDVFVENFLEHIAGRPMGRRFDGHTNCFVETGNGKALLIDFNYTTEPLPGSYPLPVFGPLRLLKETRMNHLGKLAFKPIYWHMLLPGWRLPVPIEMSMSGKDATPEDPDLTVSKTEEKV
ncbi:MAG TPA: FAD/NAD(P)-binding oxidoreductase [Acidimicrobiia bacterium]|nr:FAD/NAD(P)-binding oxidoreductase [Acidimicrobiia bacterium]